MRTAINTLAMLTVIIGIPLVMESARTGTRTPGETGPHTAHRLRAHADSDIAGQKYTLRVRLPDGGAFDAGTAD